VAQSVTALADFSGLSMPTYSSSAGCRIPTWGRIDT
jgi:hypothetical protein